MPDKLTDAEIKKALEICTSEHLGCEDGCPLDGMNCGDEIPKLALDLINRQEGVNEKNENIIRVADKTIATLNAEVERLQDSIDRYNIQVANQREQIDKYEPIKETLSVFWETMLSIGVEKRKEKPTLEEFAEAIQEIKAEAYKECIEKIKAKSKKEYLVYSGASLRTDYTITNKQLDNLLNELVGGSDA